MDIAKRLQDYGVYSPFSVFSDEIYTYLIYEHCSVFMSLTILLFRWSVIGLTLDLIQ